MPNPKIVNSETAGDMLDLSRQQISTLCRRGILSAQKIGARWIIDYDSVIAEARRRLAEIEDRLAAAEGEARAELEAQAEALRKVMDDDS